MLIMPQGIIEFQLKKSSEVLFFLSLVCFYLSLILTAVMKLYKKVSFFSSSCHFSLPLSANHGTGVSHMPLLSENSLCCHLAWRNPRPEVKLASFLLKQIHLGEASKCRTVSEHNIVTGEAGL